jgi:cytochrome P450
LATRTEIPETCPFGNERRESKSAPVAAGRIDLGSDTLTVSSFASARELLRNPKVRQAMSEDSRARFKGDRMPVFFLEGEAHRRKRMATARYFTPKAVTTKHRAVMERVTEMLVTRLRAERQGRLDQISLELAVAVTADIVGLTDSDLGGMSRRIDAFFSDGRYQWLTRFIRPAAAAWHAYDFFART